MEPWEKAEGRQKVFGGAVCGLFFVFVFCFVFFVSVEIVSRRWQNVYFAAQKKKTLCGREKGVARLKGEGEEEEEKRRKKDGTGD